MRVQREELVLVAVAVVLVVVVVVGGTVGGVGVEGRLRGPQSEDGGGIGAVHGEECGIRGGH